MRTIKLIWNFFYVGISSQMQYRANFFSQLLTSLINLATGLIGLLLVFSYTTSLQGWSEPELLAVMGVYILMGGIIRSVIQPNMQRVMEEVEDGTLDFALFRNTGRRAIVRVLEPAPTTPAAAVAAGLAFIKNAWNLTEET